MKKSAVVILVLLLLSSLFSCQRAGWRGYYEEDLSRYLTLGDYKGLTYLPADTTVREEEIDAVIQTRLHAMTTLREVEGSIAEGMTVKLDRYCFLDGVSTPELSEEGGTYVCGESYADPAVTGLLSQILGMKKTDTAEFSVTLPDGYLSEGSPSATAIYRVTVLAVYEKVLPALTDELAPKLVPGCTTLAECRAAISEDLARSKTNEEKLRVESGLRTALLDTSTLIELPYDLYQEYYTLHYMTYEQLAVAGSVSLEEYLSSSLHISKKEFESMLEERARGEVKELLVLYSVVKSEGISVTEEELRTYAEQAAMASQGVFSNGVEYLDYYGTERVTEEYLWEQVTAALLTYATPIT